MIFCFQAMNECLDIEVPCSKIHHTNQFDSGNQSQSGNRFETDGFQTVPADKLEKDSNQFKFESGQFKTGLNQFGSTGSDFKTGFEFGSQHTHAGSPMEQDFKTGNGFTNGFKK